MYEDKSNQREKAGEPAEDSASALKAEKAGLVLSPIPDRVGRAARSKREIVLRLIEWCLEDTVQV